MLGSGDVRNFRSQQHPKILLCSTVKLRIPKVHRTPHTHRVRFAITDTENETESAAYLVSKHALLTVICFCHYYCSCITTVQTLPHTKKQPIEKNSTVYERGKQNRCTQAQRMGSKMFQNIIVFLWMDTSAETSANMGWVSGLLCVLGVQVYACYYDCC